MDLVGQIDGLNAEPWLGEAFRASSFRPFFVGNSHYSERLGEELLYNDSTREVIRDHLLDEPQNFYHRLGEMTLGLPRGQIDRAALYDRVGFANLLQFYLRTPRPQASVRQLKPYVPAFLSMFDAVDPSHIILFGEEVWGAFKSDGVLKDECHRADDTWSGVIGGRPAFYLCHPASTYADAGWGEYVARWVVEEGVTDAELEDWRAAIAVS
tara:strand:+ start:38 stop:670 length:633 start_codon:yes stop_codon:yes gene_type:complete